MKKEKRFELLHKETISPLSRTVTIFRDIETGVNYLFATEGYGGGLTPLLDKDGKPIISKGKKSISD